MGLLALNRLLSFQRDREQLRRRGQSRAGNELVASLANGKRSNCQYDDIPQGVKKARYSGPELPEDIWHLIHFLMPLKDAARAAGVSHSFLRSWRCRPDITLSRETLGLNENVSRKDEISREFNRKADHILKKHSGVGLKTLKIEFCGYNDNIHCNLNRWLEIAVTPELEELTLHLPPNNAKYTFPSLLLCNGSGSSIKHLQLSWCAFSTTVGLDCLTNLTSVHLRDVRITEDELGCFFLNSTALKTLNLVYCNEITCLKISCRMQQLSCLGVFECDRLQVVENKAPNISIIHFSGNQVELSLKESLQVKHITLSKHCAVFYACSKLPSVAPNLETLSISSFYEVGNTPTSPGTFLCLKYLSITLYGAAFSCAYDCFSVVSFLDAAPLLETFVLGVSQLQMQHDSIVGDPSPLRQMAGQSHNHLKSVKITGFCSAKSLVELTRYIMENATSLECFTLDTTLGLPRCSGNKLGRCYPMQMNMVRESQKAVLAVREHIEEKIPPAVKFSVLGPCSLCHVGELHT